MNNTITQDEINRRLEYLEKYNKKIVWNIDPGIEWKAQLENYEIPVCTKCRDFAIIQAESILPKNILIPTPLPMSKSKCSVHCLWYIYYLDKIRKICLKKMELIDDVIIKYKLLLFIKSIKPDNLVNEDLPNWNIKQMAIKYKIKYNKNFKDHEIDLI